MKNKCTLLFLLLVSVVMIFPRKSYANDDKKVTWKGRPVLRFFGETRVPLSNDSEMKFVPRRTYLGYKVETNIGWSCAVVLDFTQQNNHRYMYPKYAYAGYKNEKLDLRMGLVETGIAMQSEKDWGHRYIDASYLYANHFLWSADAGIFAYYRLNPQFHLYGSASSGNGFIYVDTHKNILYTAGLRAQTQENGVGINVYGGYSPIIDKSMDKERNSPKYYLGSLLSYRTKSFRLSIEYNLLNHVHYEKESKFIHGLGTYCTFDLNSKYSLLGRWDHTLYKDFETEGVDEVANKFYVGATAKVNSFVIVYPYLKYWDFQGNKVTSLHLGIQFKL